MDYIYGMDVFWSLRGCLNVCGLIMVISFWLLSSAMRSIPVGTAYAVWMGIDAVGSVLGIEIFGDRI